MSIALSIILGFLGSSALFGFVEFLIKRHDDKKKEENDKRLTKIEKSLEKQEKDSVRLQMLVLMADYPDDKAELMKLAERYFGQLNGDWYMTGMFNKWLEENGMGKPEWFNPAS